MGPARICWASRCRRCASPPRSDGTADLGALPDPVSVLFFYPMTGRPGVALPEGWDEIPGARGCTPQNCVFRDLHEAFRKLGAGVYGLSTQTTAYQAEMAARLHLPYPVLSDADFALTDALRLPTFEADGMRLLRRLTLVAGKAVARSRTCSIPCFRRTRAPSRCSIGCGAAEFLVTGFLVSRRRNRAAAKRF